MCPKTECWQNVCTYDQNLCQNARKVKCVLENRILKARVYIQQKSVSERKTTAKYVSGSRSLEERTDMRPKSVSER
jgi:hypothetical protein